MMPDERGETQEQRLQQIEKWATSGISPRLVNVQEVQWLISELRKGQEDTARLRHSYEAIMVDLQDCRKRLGALPRGESGFGSTDDAIPPINAEMVDQIIFRMKIGFVNEGVFSDDAHRLRQLAKWLHKFDAARAGKDQSNA